MTSMYYVITRAILALITPTYSRLKYYNYICFSNRYWLQGIALSTTNLSLFNYISTRRNELI